MYLRLLISLLLLLWSVAWSAAETISEVQIKGNARVELSAIQAVISARAGTPYDPALVDRDIRALYAMGRFQDVAAELEAGEDGTILTYRLQERPLIRRVEFRGNDEFSTEKLQGLILVKTPDLYDQLQVEKSIEAIKAVYRADGYHAVTVDSDLDVDGRNEATLTFEIDEGDVVMVDSLRFEGNTVFSDRKLRKTIQTKERWLFSWLTGRGKFNEDTLKDDLERIADLYFDNGYVKIKVRKKTAELSADKRYMDIVLEIEEGSQFRVGSLDMGGDLLKDKDKADLLKLVTLEQGEIFSRKLLRESVAAVGEAYSDEGYAYVNVVPLTQLDPEQQLVNVVFDVDQGALVTIDRIQIAGNTKTRDKVIRREMKVTEGDLYSSKKLKESRRRINNLGFFEEVNLTTAQSTDAEHMNVDIGVKERPTGTFSVGAGFSSADGLIGQGSVSQENFLGKGWKLNLSASLGGKSATYQVGLLDPYFLDMNLTLGFDLYNTKREWADFTRKANGGAIKVGFPVGEYDRAFFTYRLEQKEISDVDDTATQRLKDEEERGKVLSSSLYASLTRNTTDYHPDPSTGFVMENSLELAGLGGDEKFLKYIFDYRHFYPTFWDTVFSVHGQLGYVMKIAKQDFSVDERFYLGGLRSMRGFRNREVGPYDEENDEYTGGNKEAFFNFEWIFPIFKDAGLKGVTFFDTGNAWDSNEMFFSKMRYSVGAGVRWMSPMGPLKLEWGYNLDPYDYEDKSVFEFSIGQFF